MERSTTIFIAFSIFLIIGVSMTGCSDNADTAASGTAAAATTTTPLYTAGDIVRSASGSESPAWLVVSYDPAGDSYTRALIYKNADGSYGYRTGPATETSKRATMEKVFTVKIRHVDVASVPTAAPTTVTPAETTTTTRTIATASATATTTTSTATPSIKGMDPEEGEAGTTVETDITGSDFVSNLTAQLRHPGETSITATKVTWYSSSSVTCTFDIPNSTKVGTWDIVLTNPNGRSGEITNFFMVRGNETEG
ncbi:MAG: hypothetical protein LUO98_00030 [Methanoregula sp.]|nr:hypothetical protein [Methanoregula sp.]